MVKYTADDFEIKRLGSFYDPKQTLFRVFAPDYKKLDLIIEDKVVPMFRNGFCFEAYVKGNQELSRYHFLADDKVTFCDPFSYMCKDHESYVLDKSKFEKKKVFPKTPLSAPVIYECSVRDFSSDKSFTGAYKGTFLAFTQTGLKGREGYPIGIDHIIDLGVSHIQLMPVFDFDLDKSSYNWGYNPLAYNCVCSDYVFHKDNPYAYVNELRTLVNVCHEHDIRVNLDVVFNHVYRDKEFDLGRMLAGRLYRYRKDGSLAEGTYCGNEVASEDTFVRAYIIEMVERYLELFDIDGIRMDLMGISDVRTVKQIYDTLRVKKKDFMVYGEGWNMGDVLDEGHRACINNAEKIPGVGMFNDYFRDTMIHYLSGNDMIEEDVRRTLKADPSYLNERQSINYVECHDDYTFYDRMMIYKKEDSKRVNGARSKMAMALVMLSRGIPFIHSGEEFLRTKKGTRNSYNSGDMINKIDWQRRQEMEDVVLYLKKLIQIRKQYPCFTQEEVRISFESYYGSLIYLIGPLMIFINPTGEEILYDDGTAHEVIFDEGNRSESDGSLICISPYSVVICVD